MARPKKTLEPVIEDPFVVESYKDGRLLCKFSDDIGSRSLLLFTEEQLKGLSAFLRSKGY